MTKTNQWSQFAQAFVRRHFPESTVVQGERGDPAPATVREWSGDYLISFLCPWVLPAQVIASARRAAINFHPAPPQYPGIGCYNFALYDGAQTYGVTCHRMAPVVDSGPIVDVRRFAILPADTVESLKGRSMATLLVQFYDILTCIANDSEMPASSERWSGPRRTRRELDELCRITPDLSQDEIARRIRATVFPSMPGPFIEIGGRRFDYRPDRRDETTR